MSSASKNSTVISVLLLVVLFLTSLVVFDAFVLKQSGGANMQEGGKFVCLSDKRQLGKFMSIQPQQEPMEEDPLKWEKMYAAEDSTSLSNVDEPAIYRYGVPVKVMSFDLDDTLWDTQGIIGHSNMALNSFLALHYPAMANTSIPTEMRRIWNEYMAVDPSLGNEPASLSWLRKEALKQTAIAYNYSNPEEIANEVFDYWHHERLAVEPFIFEGVLDVLMKLKEKGIMLGAITNGNADVSRIPALRDIFSFHVMSEEVGERKPHAAPFKEAVQRATKAGAEPDLGASWVHVGDDLKGDCVGAKALNMRTILVNPPTKSKESALAEEESNSIVENSLPEDLPNIPLGGSVTMEALGTDDYMAEMIKNDFVDAEVNQFSKLLQVVDNWNEEAELMKNRAQQISSAAPIESSVKGVPAQAASAPGNTVPNMVTEGDLELMKSKVIMASERSSLDALKKVVSEKEQSLQSQNLQLLDTSRPSDVMNPTEEISETIAAESNEGAKTTKFCFECGAKIPRVAKFCSECGTKQVM
mmetsp:Transcript_30669/g.39351  ORF Transcript_30669/g.39351 Transcript_30669/m.39351 type:complete len:528 (+) Transcript_30669:70-1653(+)